ncbi:methyl-accepting chemotaxis protein [Pseudomonas taiwanensis]|uniref:Methyl-accepting chemotaxis protein n=2 Tax=Pseudomonas taiwanensis TaxID=470150 RepID=A0ABR6V9X4_9PSED|nr:methyl-accepting chemotaxis protein [Pseudomonas taiwanensis]MBC3476677.1 methyl-accepting chemotaxis protein [Pseudomonas taiwanensis]
MKIRRIGIALRATLGFSCIALLSLLLGMFSLQKINEVQFEAMDIKDNWLQRARILGAASASLNRYRMASMQHIFSDNDEEMASYESKAAHRLIIIRKEMAEYGKLLNTAQEKQELVAFNRMLENYVQRHQQLFPISRRGDKVGARNHLLVIRDDYDSMTKTFDGMIAQANKGADVAGQRSMDAYDRAIQGVIIVITLVGLGTIIIAWLLSRSIIQPLKEAVAVAQSVASGDLTMPIRLTGNDEATHLLSALQTMQQSLLDTLRQIRGSSTQLATAAEELNAVTSEGSQEARRQHSEIEQAATAVTEMTSAIEHVASNAATTSDLSQETQQIALRGQKVMDETLGSLGSLATEVVQSANKIERLAAQTQGIGKVLDVIRTIAEQTNLLALNAAIEAARAGDAGRGFAVVADEVRALAHRTAESTREIEEIIVSIQNGTEGAVHAMQSNNDQSKKALVLAQTALAALEDIVSANEEISRRNLVITTATEEQALVARSVDRNLVNIRDLSIQGTAGASQITSASNELARLAAELESMVGKFQTA